MQIRWGIVGPGRLADETIAPAITASKTGHLTACAGRTLDRAKEFARKHKVERAYPSFEELMQDPSVDAVFVATPNNLHHPVVLSAASAAKHVLCDKPMAISAREAEAMVAACRAAGRILRVGLQMRFTKILQAARAAVAERRLGEVRIVYARRNWLYDPRTHGALWRKELARAGAGALSDTGVHAIDYVRWIVGDRVSRAFAFAHPPRESGLPDETMTVLMEFSRGCQATVQISRELPMASHDLQVYGTRGMLATGPLRWAERQRLTIRTLDGSVDYEYPPENPFLLEIDAFAEEVAGRRTAMATGDDGLALAKVTDAALRSLETGAAVVAEG